MVTVKFFSHLRRALGTPELQLDARTIADVVDQLSARYGSAFTDKIGHCKVYVNGANVGLKKGKRTKLGAGDEVVVLPPVAGG